MLKIQEWLNENNHNFEKLEEELGVKSKLYSDRIVLNYSQLAGDKFNPISMEARGLILRYPDTDKIITRSFDRFFNYKEDPRSDEFNISKAIIYEKVDGSLINVSHDGKDWCISTRSMAFAEGETSHGPTYKELVLRTRPYLFESMVKVFNINFIHNHTFIFELCTAENRVVKQYQGDKLFLLGIRDKNSGFFLHDWDVDNIAKKITVDRPAELFVNSWESLTDNISKLPAMDEGYVCNWDNWRIKIKNPAYLAIHHLRENGIPSPKRITALIFLNDYAEYLSYFPEDKKFFTPYIAAYEEFRENLEYIWICTKDIKDQKEFALEVKDLKISGFLFNMRKGLSYEDCIKNLNDNKKLDILEYYKEGNNEEI